jgi:hypothetical protein
MDVPLIAVVVMSTVIVADISTQPTDLILLVIYGTKTSRKKYNGSLLTILKMSPSADSACHLPTA